MAMCVYIYIHIMISFGYYLHLSPFTMEPHTSMVSSAHEAPPSPPPDRQGPNHESLMCVMGSTYTVGEGKCEKTKTKMPLLLAAYVLSLLFSGLFEKSCMFNKHIVFFLVV